MNVISIIIFLLSISPFLIMSFTKKYLHFVLLGILSVLIHGIYFFGYKIIYLVVFTYVISTVAELISLKTKFNIFGANYKYNLEHRFFSSKINLLGVYPLEISFTWILFKYLSFCIAAMIISAFSTPHGWMLLLVPLILLSLDFVVDPFAVNIIKMWKWERGSKYFGIPIGNFVGWFLVGLVSTFFYFDINFKLSFDVLLFLPIIFYAIILQHAKYLYKIDRKNMIIGATPGVIWIILGLASLFKV